MHERADRAPLQVGLLTEEASNTPAAVEYLLGMVPYEGADARIGGPPDAGGRVFGSAPLAAAADSSATATDYGIYPATVELVNRALQVLA